MEIAKEFLILVFNKIDKHNFLKDEKALEGIIFTEVWIIPNQADFEDINVDEVLDNQQN